MNTLAIFYIDHPHLIYCLHSYSWLQGPDNAYQAKRWWGRGKCWHTLSKGLGHWMLLFMQSYQGRLWDCIVLSGEFLYCAILYLPTCLSNVLYRKSFACSPVIRHKKGGHMTSTGRSTQDLYLDLFFVCLFVLGGEGLPSETRIEPAQIILTKICVFII